MKPVRLMLAFLALAVPAGACGSNGESVTGHILGEDRSGIVGLDVELARGGSPTGSHAVTDSDGHFSIEIPAGVPSDHLEVWLHTPQAVWGFVSSPTVEPSLDFGDIPMWTAHLRVNAQADSVEVDWVDMFAWFEQPVRFALSAGGNGTVWAVESVDLSNAVLDPRVLQDQDVTFTISLLTSPTETVPGLLLYPNFESPVGLTGTRVPLSRDLACQVDGTDYPTGACPITDGQFGDGLTGAIAEVILDLTTTADLSAVTLHGAADQSGTNAGHFELSTDCLAYTEVGVVDLWQYVLATWTAAPARCLKIRFDHALSSLDEIGVW